MVTKKGFPKPDKRFDGSQIRSQMTSAMNTALKGAGAPRKKR